MTTQQYLMIENDGEISPEAFVLLGVSSARDNSESIGQFGTGSKHGVLVLLRNQINPVIYAGRTKIEPFVRHAIVDDKTYSRVCYKIGNKTEQTSMTTDFGELDWKDDVNMALREFISNAIDATSGKWSDITLKVVENPRAASGKTRVFVPIDQRIIDYITNIDSHFLHRKGLENTRILKKENKSPCRLYRKGVFVRELSCSSIFDYNFGDDMKIDESRNLDSWTGEYHAKRMLCEDLESVKECIARFSINENLEDMEHEIDYYTFRGAILKEAWDSLYNHEIIVVGGALEAQVVREKGHIPIVMPISWANALCKNGVRGLTSVVTAAEREIGSIHDASAKCIAAVQKVWQLFVDLGANDGKDIPEIYQYEPKQNKDGVKVLGYQFDNAVYFSDEFCENRRVIIEELAHYVSERADETREFQDFNFCLLDKCFELLS